MFISRYDIFETLSGPDGNKHDSFDRTRHAFMYANWIFFTVCQLFNVFDEIYRNIIIVSINFRQITKETFGWLNFEPIVSSKWRVARITLLRSLSNERFINWCLSTVLSWEYANLVYSNCSLENERIHFVHQALSDQMNNWIIKEILTENPGYFLQASNLPQKTQPSLGSASDLRTHHSACKGRAIKLL